MVTPGFEVISKAEIDAAGPVKNEVEGMIFRING